MTPSGKEKITAALARLDAGATFSTYLAISNVLHELTPADTGLLPLKVAISRNFTVDAMLPVFEAELARSGFHVTLHVGEFDAISQDLLDPRSPLYEFQPDFIILAQWLETLAPRFATRFLSLSAAEAEAETARIVADLRGYLTAIRSHTRVPVLINNFVLPAHPTLGILDSQSDHSERGSVARLNERLLQAAHEFSDVFIVDLAALVSRIGYAQAIDERYWHLGRAPLSRVASTQLAREYVKFVRALRGLVRKCLVLDCDNTLWGGVIGEDGMQGIKIGTTYPGSGYLAFQRELLNLKDRGVILAICSKNNEADVREVLRSHPEMLLREEHFAAWQINWDDKATNLRRLAEQLNLGLEAFVFVDDSRFECDFVRENLPQVEVLHLATEPFTFTSLLGSGAYFDSLTFSSEDRSRTEQYQAEAQRKALEASASSLPDYLARLQIVATIALADDLTIPRIAQLTQKTNQFNLTTHRYSEGAIRSYRDDPNVDVFSMRLRDRLSDLGLIGVAILKYEQAGVASIDTFLMSCRALGRRAEDCLLAHCLQAARNRGCQRVQGRYIATPKNAQVADFYSRSGFKSISDAADTSSWEFQFDRDVFSPPDFVQVEGVEPKDTYAHK